MIRLITLCLGVALIFFGLQVEAHRWQDRVIETFRGELSDCLAKTNYSIKAAIPTTREDGSPLACSEIKHFILDVREGCGYFTTEDDEGVVSSKPTSICVTGE